MSAPNVNLNEHDAGPRYTVRLRHGEIDDAVDGLAVDLLLFFGHEPGEADKVFDEVEAMIRDWFEMVREPERDVRSVRQEGERSLLLFPTTSR